MSVKLAAMLVLALGLGATGAYAQGAPQKAAPGSEEEWVRTHLGSIIRVKPVRLVNPAVLAVFGAPLYNVVLSINEEDGGATTSVLVARAGDSLQAVSRPSTTRPAPEFLKLLKPSFLLNSDMAAITFQSALDELFEVSGFDKDVKAYTHKGNEWTFVRGKFFEDKMGFVVTTNARGAITAVRYELKLPPAAS